MQKNNNSNYKFAIVINEKSPIGNVMSAVGQLGMALLHQATEEQRENMDFNAWRDLHGVSLGDISTCSFVVLKGKGSQLQTLFATAREHGLLSATFPCTMTYAGVEEDLRAKTASMPVAENELFAVGVFGTTEELAPLTKKFSVFK